jgi:hypothetical protein
MRTIWCRAPLCAVFWSVLARGQAPPLPAPPAPSPSPSPSPPVPPPPASAGVTGVRAPDATAVPPPPADQGPDTLPSLEEEEEEEPQPAPPRKASRAAAGRPPIPIRRARRLALTGEIGWNGLAGFGAVVSYHVHPQLTFDLGVGLALVGGKVGLRTRYNLLDGAVTPFVGAGFMGATGFDAPTRDLGGEDGNTDLNIELKPSAFLQAVAGIDWTRRDGFTLVGALGYAWLLTGDNVVIVTGEPTADERQGLDIAFRSSIVLSIAIGYSFR